MRYKLPIDRLVNQLVPHYLKGRTLILFIQSCLYPLRELNLWFINFTKELQVEASMTSQVICLEWYLNHKLRPYFHDDRLEIKIVDTQPVGVDLYFEESNIKRPYAVWFQSESIISGPSSEHPRPLFRLLEQKALQKASFMVCVPQVTINEQEFLYMLSHIVNRYKIAGKTYIVRIEKNEFEPNKNTN